MMIRGFVYFCQAIQLLRASSQQRFLQDASLLISFYLEFNIASYRCFFEDAVSALIIGAIPSTVAIPTIVASLIVHTRPSYEVITVIFAL